MPAKAWDKTNDEDVALAEWKWRGVQSPTYAPGPNSVARGPILGRWLAAYRDRMVGGAAQ